MADISMLLATQTPAGDGTWGSSSEASSPGMLPDDEEALLRDLSVPMPRVPAGV